MPARHLVQQPQTLIGFLKTIGGLRTCDEVTARDLRKVYPGLVNDKRGYSLDKAREVAAEAGFLGADVNAAMAETTVNDFLNALDSHPHYRDADQDRLCAWEMMNSRAAEIAAAVDVAIEAVTGETLPPYVEPVDSDFAAYDDPTPATEPRALKAKAWRESRGLSRPKLAALTGYSIKSVYNFEAGRYTGKPGADALIPPRAWRAYALACADIDAKFPTPF